jgi:predicted histidine transporter YuiF (NhaC family)
MEERRPVVWGITSGLVISFLGLGSYFGLLLYERFKVGWDIAGMSAEQWVVDVAIWLCVLGAFVTLIGILWFLIRRRS